MADRLPLSALLSQVLVAFDRELADAGAGPPSEPSLALWANLLRLVGEDGIEQRDLPTAARLSRRAIRALVAAAVRQGWVTVEADPVRRGAKVVRLTPRGRDGTAAWEPRTARVEASWRRRLGDDAVGTLRSLLVALVGQFSLELPHRPTSYGPADSSITGGGYGAAPAEPGIPPHGQDWPPVLRDRGGASAGDAGGTGDPVAALPLPALLSQALVAIAIEFENGGLGSLSGAANVIRQLDGQGRPVPRADLPDLPEVTGSGKSALERHGYLVVAPDPADRRVKTVRLTPRGQQVHAAYGPRLAEIEDGWHDRYGADLVDGLRSSLEGIVAQLDGDLPHHPPPAGD